METSMETVNQLTREVSGAMWTQDILNAMICRYLRGSISSGPTRLVQPLTETAECAEQRDLDLEAVDSILEAVARTMVGLVKEVVDTEAMKGSTLGLETMDLDLTVDLATLETASVLGAVHMETMDLTL